MAILGLFSISCYASLGIHWELALGNCTVHLEITSDPFMYKPIISCDPPHQPLLSQAVTRLI